MLCVLTTAVPSPPDRSRYASASPTQVNSVVRFPSPVSASSERSPCSSKTTVSQAVHVVPRRNRTSRSSEPDHSMPTMSNDPSIAGEVDPPSTGVRSTSLVAPGRSSAALAADIGGVADIARTSTRPKNAYLPSRIVVLYWSGAQSMIQVGAPEPRKPRMPRTRIASSTREAAGWQMVERRKRKAAVSRRDSGSPVHRKEGEDPESPVHRKEGEDPTDVRRRRRVSGPRSWPGASCPTGPQ